KAVVYELALEARSIRETYNTRRKSTIHADPELRSSKKKLANALDDLPLTMCRKPTRSARRYQHGRTLIDAMMVNNLRGLTGDLRRLNGNPAKSNYSMRIQLLGYSGKLEDIGFWEPATEVHVNMSGDSREQLRKNVQVSDELKPHFRVTTIMERPYVMLKKNHYELYANSKFEGFCIDLLAELSKDLGK
ncbi:hypothetical protein ANCDUO_27331, partial [Ancylostoma duodenale]